MAKNDVDLGPVLIAIIALVLGAALFLAVLFVGAAVLTIALAIAGVVGVVYLLTAGWRRERDLRRAIEGCPWPRLSTVRAGGGVGLDGWFHDVLEDGMKEHNLKLTRSMPATELASTRLHLLPKVLKRPEVRVRCQQEVLSPIYERFRAGDPEVVRWAEREAGPEEIKRWKSHSDFHGFVWRHLQALGGLESLLRRELPSSSTYKALPPKGGTSHFGAATPIRAEVKHDGALGAMEKQLQDPRNWSQPEAFLERVLKEVRAAEVRPVDLEARMDLVATVERAQTRLEHFAAAYRAVEERAPESWPSWAADALAEVERSGASQRPDAMETLRGAACRNWVMSDAQLPRGNHLEPGIGEDFGGGGQTPPSDQAEELGF